MAKAEDSLATAYEQVAKSNGTLLTQFANKLGDVTQSALSDNIKRGARPASGLDNPASGLDNNVIQYFDNRVADVRHFLQNGSEEGLTMRPELTAQEIQIIASIACLTNPKNSELNAKAGEVLGQLTAGQLLATANKINTAFNALDSAHKNISSPNAHITFTVSHDTLCGNAATAVAPSPAK